MTPLLSHGKCSDRRPKRRIKLGVQCEEETFKVFKAREHPDTDEVFYIGAVFSPPTLAPTTPIVTRKKKKRHKHEKFKCVIKEIKEKVTTVTEKLKRRRLSNIDV